MVYVTRNGRARGETMACGLKTRVEMKGVVSWRKSENERNERSLAKLEKRNGEVGVAV